jgi:hypothetical protein
MDILYTLLAALIGLGFGAMFFKKPSESSLDLDTDGLIEEEALRKHLEEEKQREYKLQEILDELNKKKE